MILDVSNNVLYLVQETFLYQSIYILQKNIKSIGKVT